MDLTNENFENEVLKSETPVLVDFWAPWCGPCKVISPLVDQIAQDYSGKLKVAKLNVDDNSQIAMTYGIMSIPALKIFKGGKVVSEIIGAQPKESIARIVDVAINA